jgi:hypothetical protein
VSHLKTFNQLLIPTTAIVLLALTGCQENTKQAGEKANDRPNQGIDQRVNQPDAQSVRAANNPDQRNNPSDAQGQSNTMGYPAGANTTSGGSTGGGTSTGGTAGTSTGGTSTGGTSTGGTAGTSTGGTAGTSTGGTGDKTTGNTTDPDR